MEGDRIAKRRTVLGQGQYLGFAQICRMIRRSQRDCRPHRCRDRRDATAQEITAGAAHAACHQFGCQFFREHMLRRVLDTTDYFGRSLHGNDRLFLFADKLH
jgi:hypothetical protein